MSFQWSDYSLDELRSHATQVFRQGGGSRPDVMLIEFNGHKAVLKDQAGADKWFALLVGPILNWRETKALKHLHEVQYVPQLLHTPSTRSFLMSYHESEQISHLQHISPDWPVFFERLESAIQAVHRAGVAHNDLRNPSNTLVTPQGEPVLVDLVACFCRGRAWNWPNHWLFTKFAQVDLSALTKLKTRFAPQLLHESDIQAEQIAGKTGMAIKGLGQKIRRLSRRLFTDQQK